MAYIYKITNDVNGKQYVGKTEFSIERRFKEHQYDATRRKTEKRPLYRAINKYGIEHFHIELIEETDKPEEREQYWIQQLDTYKNGYNATLGGDGKRYLDYDLICNLYKELKSYTKVAKEVHCDPMIVSKITKERGIPTYRMPKNNQKAVAQCDKQTGEILTTYESLCSASRAIKGNTSAETHIGDCAKNKRKTAYGYKWIFI